MKVDVGHIRLELRYFNNFFLLLQIILSSVLNNNEVTKALKYVKQVLILNVFKTSKCEFMNIPETNCTMTMPFLIPENYQKKE